MDVGFTKHDHMRLRNTVLSSQGKFLISYNERPEIREIWEHSNIQIEQIKRMDNLRLRFDTVCADVRQNAIVLLDVIPDDGVAGMVLDLVTSLSRVIEDDYRHKERQFRSRVDRKLRRMIQRHKEAIGLKTDGQQCN